MTTRTTTVNTTGRITRNSLNAGHSTDIAFGRRNTLRPDRPSNRNNSDRTASDNHGNGGDPGDDDHGNGDENPGEPDDDEPPNEDGPGDPSDDPDDSDDEVQHNLANAISALAKNVKHQGDGSRSKVREPDPFDGTDPAKLRTFLVQLQLSFRDRPSAFSDDSRKVNFAISYLKGIALAHFENSLIEPDLDDPPPWGDDYDEFVAELNIYFGSPDVVGEAENKLESLSMKPTQRITKYIVEFNRYSTVTGWDNRALRHQFYRGLPARIKDEVSRVGKPARLSELRILAQSIDGRYWEREEETRRERGGQSSEKKTEKTHHQPHSSSSNQLNQNKSQKKQFHPRESSSSAHNPDKKKSDLGDKLGKDGKLTAAERARRFANNLCLFCGGVGHSARECPKSSSSAAKAKGRAAKGKSDKSDKAEGTSAEDSKK